MTTPRLRRLGLLGAGSILALVVSTLAPLGAQADPSPTGPSLVTVTKSMPGSPNNGGPVTATLTVTNPTGGALTGVVIEDYYDHGLTYVADDHADCVDVPASPTNFGRVVCTFVSLPINATVVNIDFTANYVGPTMYSFWRKHHERMEIQKAENHISLLEDDIKTVTVSCETGYHIMDFGLVKQHVDQDEGDYEHIRVITSDVVDERSYSVTLENTSTGQAQAKVYATCIKDTTNDATTLTFTPLQQVTATLHPQGPSETRPLYAYCPPVHTPIAVDVRAVKDTPDHPSGSAYSDGLIIVHGFEADGGQRTRLWVEALQPAKVTVEWQCMKTETSSGRPMQFDFLVTGTKNVAAGAKKRKKLECNTGYKGVIGGWHGGKINGSEPQPIARVFWFYNETGTTQNFDLTLLCLRNRLLKNNRLEIDDTVKERLINVVSGVEKTTPLLHKWILKGDDFVDVKY